MIVGNKGKGIVGRAKAIKEIQKDIDQLEQKFLKLCDYFIEQGIFTVEEHNHVIEHVISKLMSMIVRSEVELLTGMYESYESEENVKDPYLSILLYIGTTSLQYYVSQLNQGTRIVFETNVLEEKGEINMSIDNINMVNLQSLLSWLVHLLVCKHLVQKKKFIKHPEWYMNRVKNDLLTYKR